MTQGNLKENLKYKCVEETILKTWCGYGWVDLTRARFAY